MNVLNKDSFYPNAERRKILEHRKYGLLPPHRSLDFFFDDVPNLSFWFEVAVGELDFDIRY